MSDQHAGLLHMHELGRKSGRHKPRCRQQLPEWGATHSRASGGTSTAPTAATSTSSRRRTRPTWARRPPSMMCACSWRRR